MMVHRKFVLLIR